MRTFSIVCTVDRRIKPRKLALLPSCSNCLLSDLVPCGLPMPDFALSFPLGERINQLEDPLGAAVSLSKLLSGNERLFRQHASAPLVKEFARMIRTLGPQARKQREQKILAAAPKCLHAPERAEVFYAATECMRAPERVEVF